MEDEFRVRIDMGTTIRQRRNLLRSFNELVSMFQSGPVMEADLQMVKASRVARSCIAASTGSIPCPRNTIDLQFLTLTTLCI